MVAETVCPANIVEHHDERLALSRQFAEQSHCTRLMAQIQVLQRFIQQITLWRLGKQQSNTRALALAAGKRNKWTTRRVRSIPFPRWLHLRFRGLTACQPNIFLAWGYRPSNTYSCTFPQNSPGSSCSMNAQNAGKFALRPGLRRFPRHHYRWLIVSIGVAQAGQCMDQSRFAATVLAEYRPAFARIDGQAQVWHSILSGYRRFRFLICKIIHLICVHV